MADTTFVAQVTAIVSTWLQAANNLVYRGRNPNYATTTGSANAQILTLATGSLYTSESSGDSFRFTAGYTNSAAMTLQVIPPSGTNTAGAVQFMGQALIGGEVIAGQPYEVTRVGSTWQLTSLAGTAFSGTLLQAPSASAARTVLNGAALSTNLFTGLQAESEGAAVVSAGTIDIWATDGNTRHVTGATGPITSMGTAPQAGAWMKLIFDSTPTLTQGANLNLNGGGSDIAIEAGDVAFVYADTTTQLDVFVIRKSGAAIVTTVTTPSVRQCVLEGPVTSAGLPNYGASTGSSTVTVTGTLKATAAYGELDRIGSISGPSWTGLNSAGARYFLYLTVNADGTCTTGSSLNLQPTVQWGGTYGTSNGQHTFNIQEMTGKVGNGATADQAYRVYVGEVTVSGANVVDAIYWYQLKRRYQATSTSVPSTTRITMQHYLGFIPDEWSVKLVCTSTELGYGNGEEVEAHAIMDAGTNPITNSSVADRFDMGIVANSNTLYLYNKTTGALTAIDTAKWDTKFYAKGSW